ncbi:uncharacterized protein [Physcomitrium patens]|uniref:uncharacterized protein n=1 Tax=Physcomitrium patens TaxID=3218 RepID=UPI000D16750C|nr:uncharacterized protein LOC112281114 [Physcomitrium patens]|eukprot:XP_024373074.1 uncharacterized protein LOC112281114 [Physcomitrella patens]
MNQVLQLLRASLTSVNVMSEVFGKSLGETCVITTNQVNLPSTPSQYKTFSSEEEKSEQAPQHNPVRQAQEIARHLGARTPHCLEGNPGHSISQRQPCELREGEGAQDQLCFARLELPCLKCHVPFQQIKLH